MPWRGLVCAVETGVIGTDAIKVAMIYKPASVTPLGNLCHPGTLSVDPRFDDTKNRPALAQTSLITLTGGFLPCSQPPQIQRVRL